MKKIIVAIIALFVVITPAIAGSGTPNYVLEDVSGALTSGDNGYTFYVAVKNVGGDAYIETQTALNVEQSRINMYEFRYPPGLAEGEHHVAEYEYTILNIYDPTCYITGIADAEGELTETSESDNTVPKVHCAAMLAETNDLLPAFGSNNMQYGSNECYFGIGVENAGDGMSGLSVTSMSITPVGGATTVCPISTPGVYGGGVEQVYCEYGFEEGGYHITYTVDSTGAVAETNEGNNVMGAEYMYCNPNGAN